MTAVPPLKILTAFSVKTPAKLVAAAKQAALAAWKGLPVGLRGKKLKGHPTPFRLVISFVGNSQSQKLNAHYRKKDRPTDVLSFSRLNGEPFPGEAEIGELILCLPVCLRQAKEYGVTAEEELQRLTVHGVLHLFGYDHETSLADEKKMFALQERILKTLTKKSPKLRRPS